MGLPPLSVVADSCWTCREEPLLSVDDMEVRELGEQSLFAGAAIDGLKAKRADRKLRARSPVPVRRRGGTCALRWSSRRICQFSK